jgi:hypothetical protein
MRERPCVKQRLRILDEFIPAIDTYLKGALLVGSMAYGRASAVTEASDIDLLFFSDRFKDIAQAISSEQLSMTLQTRYVDGLCLKMERENVPISVHLFSERAGGIIANCFVADIRVLRPGGKAGSYLLKGFEGQSYEYVIKNIALPEAPSYCRTIVPVGFISNDRYYLGIHRDKILSAPKALIDQGGFCDHLIDASWRVTCENLIDESYRLLGGVDTTRLSVTNALAKFDRMDAESRAQITKRMSFGIERALQEKRL